LATGLRPDPLGKLPCSPNPKLDFWGRREGERRRRRGIRGGKGLGGKGKGAVTGILREGSHVANYGTAGEYRLG